MDHLKLLHNPKEIIQVREYNEILDLESNL
jgi:hypothetical protein